MLRVRSELDESNRIRGPSRALQLLVPPPRALENGFDSPQLRPGTQSVTAG